MIIVGRALARDIPVSRLYDAGFAHEYRKGRRGDEGRVSREKGR
jgi:precorrin-4 methylase